MSVSWGYTQQHPLVGTMHGTIHKRVSDAFLNLDAFVGCQTVSFAMYPRSSLFVWSLYQAEHLASAFIKPVLQVRDHLFVLRLYICLMSLLDGRCRQSIDFVVDVHIKWHYISPSV